MRTLRVTHIDLDGLSPYILDRYYNPDYKDEDYIFINYGEEYKLAPEKWTGQETDRDLWLPTDYDRIVVTDLGLTEDFYKFLKTHYNHNYLWLDHHNETRDNGEGDPNVIYDLKSSGTKLYFDYLTKGTRRKKIISDFVNLVDCYDRFDKQNPLWEDAQNLNRLLYGSGSYREKTKQKVFKFFIESQIQKFHFLKKFEFTEQEMNIIQKAKEKEDLKTDEAKASMLVRTDNAGYKFGLTQLDSKISIATSRILEEGEIDYLIVVNTFKGVNGRMHLRISENSDLTSNDFDGFKGHDKAAGGSLDKKTIVKLWSNRWNYINKK